MQRYKKFSRNQHLACAKGIKRHQKALKGITGERNVVTLQCHKVLTI